MRVLIGGERFGVIRDAMLERGIDAMSCDLVDTEVPGPHYKGDWRDIEGDGWDLAVFHRTCTNMANSGSKHLFKGMNKANGINWVRIQDCLRDAWEFWNHMQTCPIPHVGWENPIMVGYAKTMVGPQDQTVQPWWFGTDPGGPDNVTKATCWWLKNLPKLKRTGTLDGSTARDEVFRMAPTVDPEERRMARSKFYPGHAKAIVEQWALPLMNR